MNNPINEIAHKYLKRDSHHQYQEFNPIPSGTGSGISVCRMLQDIRMYDGTGAASGSGHLRFKSASGGGYADQ